MVKKSIVDIAYEAMNQWYDSGRVEAIPFAELCEEVCSRLELIEDEFASIASRFYTDLTIDGRFVIKENNTWTLRKHEKYANVHIDMNDVYIDEVEPEEEELDIGELGTESIGDEFNEDVDDDLDDREDATIDTDDSDEDL